MKLYKVISVWEFLILLILLLFSLSLLLFYLKGMGSSFAHQGIKSLHKKDFAEAQKNFNQALVKKPFDTWSYMNLALIHDLLKTPDKALKYYNIVSSHLVKQSNLAAFFSYFNKGELYGRLGQLENALENYQKALEFKYKEKEIKKNIEFLFKDNQQSQKNSKEKRQEKNKSENKEEQQGKDLYENKEEQENKNQQNNDENSKDTKKSPDERKQQAQSGDEESKPGNKNKEKKDSKGLSEKEQKAILEEIEKQENKVRARFYQRKRVFGDKTAEDW